MNPEALFTDVWLIVARAIASADLAALRACVVGVDLDAPGREGATLLLFALWCARGGEPARAAVITALVQAGADPLRRTDSGLGSALDVALCAESPLLLRALLDAGVSPETRVTEGGATLLRHVIYGPTQAHRRLLMTRGATLDAQDAMGRTAIFWALCEAELDAVHDLLDQGANPWVIDSTGDSFGSLLDDLLRTAAPDSVDAQNLERLRVRVVSLGMPWPPANAADERARMRAAGLTPVLPHGAAT